MSISMGSLRRERVQLCTDERVIGSINISLPRIGWVACTQVRQWQVQGIGIPFPNPETGNSY